MIFQAIGLGLSLYQMTRSASESKDAADESAVEARKNAELSLEAAKDKKVIEDLQRNATANSMIADVLSQNSQVEQLQRASDLMGMQGKADAVIRIEQYNQLASTQMVMGAASGRVMDGQGGLGAMFDKSYEDYMWDQMWNEETVKINQAALAADMVSVYEAGAVSLILGTEQLRISGLASQLDITNAERGLDIQTSQIQTAYEDSIRATNNTFMNNLGSSGVMRTAGSLLDFGSPSSYNSLDDGWLY